MTLFMLAMELRKRSVEFRKLAVDGCGIEFSEAVRSRCLWVSRYSSSSGTASILKVDTEDRGRLSQSCFKECSQNSAIETRRPCECLTTFGRAPITSNMSHFIIKR